MVRKLLGLWKRSTSQSQALLLSCSACTDSHAATGGHSTITVGQGDGRQYTAGSVTKTEAWWDAEKERAERATAAAAAVAPTAAQRQPVTESA